MSGLRPPPHLRLNLPKAVPRTPRGRLAGPRGVRRARGSRPHRCSQPANLPPRDYIKQSPPPGCARGVARGRGWRGAGKDGCFPGLVIFPAAGWLAQLVWGVDPDPRKATARPRSTEVGSGKVRIQPSIFCFPFYFHPLVLFSPTSSLVVGEVRRGRGRQRRGRTGDIPVHQACWVRVPARHSQQTTWLWLWLAGGSGAGSETQRLASVSPCAPLPMETGQPSFGFKCVCIYEMSASECPALTLGSFHSLLLMLIYLQTAPGRSPAC